MKTKTDQTFNKLTEFNKQYNLVRKDILQRHGFKEGDKVKLQNAIAMYQKFNGYWIKTTTIKTDMIERIKMNDITGEKATYMLKALV